MIVKKIVWHCYSTAKGVLYNKLCTTMLYALSPSVTQQPSFVGYIVVWCPTLGTGCYYTGGANAE